MGTRFYHCHPQFNFSSEWLNVHSQLTGFHHLFNMISENQYRILMFLVKKRLSSQSRSERKPIVIFRAEIRHKMYQLVSKVLTLTKIAPQKNKILK